MRYKLINELADLWRLAETQYLASNCEDDTYKTLVAEKQEMAHLTEEETRELEEQCQSIGV